jgi:hypothetical protein
MSSVDNRSVPALGFLTVVDHPQHGLFGGYLVLNKCGRPLEFHCTAPIKPNRAQQILYGPTLAPFLYGEQIGQTLVQKGRHEPLVVCTDLEPVLAVRPHVSMPVVLVLSPAPTASNDTSACIEIPHFGGQEKIIQRVDPSHGGPGGLVRFRLGRNELALSEGTAAADQPSIAERVAELAETFDLGEPFGRIREAIEEAQRAVR